TRSQEGPMHRAAAVLTVALGLLGCPAPPATATVDVTGSWGVIVQSIIGPLPGTFDLVQAGTQLELTYTLQGGAPNGPYTGTIDPDTGTFTVPLPDTQTSVPPSNQQLTCSGNQITGTASPDSQSIGGYWTIMFLNVRLFCQDGGGAFTATPAGCGDGVLES